MKKRIVYFVLATVFLLSFALLSKNEDRQFMRNLDFAVTVKVQERIDRSAHLRLASLVGNTMEGATFFSSPEFTVVVTILITAKALYDRRRKQWNYKAFVIPLALTMLGLIEIFGKSIVHHPSPMYSMIKNPTSIFPANYINEQFSYPSGNAARAVFLSFVLLLTIEQLNNNIMKKRLSIGLGLGIYVALVSVSRVYLGHHWLSDVIGGILVGSALGVLTWMSVPPYNT